MPNLHNEHAETSALNKIERYNLQYNLKQQSKNNAAPTLIRYLQIEWQAFYSKFIFERPSTALVQSTERSLINCIYQRGIVNILLLLFPSPSFGLCSGPSQIMWESVQFQRDLQLLLHHGLCPAYLHCWGRYSETRIFSFSPLMALSDNLLNMFAPLM